MRRTATILALLALCVTACGAPTNSTNVSSRPAISRLSRAAGPAGWTVPVNALEVVPDSPLPPRTEPALGTLGDRFVVYGGMDQRPGESGDRPATGGAIFDPSDGSWTLLPSGPFDLPLYHPALAELSDGFLLLGTLCDSMQEIDSCRPGSLASARFIESTGSWQVLSLPDHPAAHPDSPTEHGSLFGGPESSGVEALLNGSWFAFDSESSSWSRLDDPPFTPNKICATSDGLVVASIPNREEAGDTNTDQEAKDPVALPDTTSFKAAVLSDDGKWAVKQSQVAAGTVATSELLFCTHSSTVAVGIEPGHRSIYALRFRPKLGTWEKLVLPEINLGFPEGWPTVAGALLADPAAGTSLFNDGPGTWQVSPLSVGNAGPAIVGRNDTFFGLVDDKDSSAPLHQALKVGRVS